MPLPPAVLTTTCDIYRFNPPPLGAQPASTDVPCQLLADYSGGTRVVNLSAKPWTHYLLLDSSTDVRDSYPGAGGTWQFGNADTVHIPSGGTTAYAVVFVELCGKGTAGEHKRVYLDRQLPSWPAL